MRIVLASIAALISTQAFAYSLMLDLATSDYMYGILVKEVEIRQNLSCEEPHKADVNGDATFSIPLNCRHQLDGSIHRMVVYGFKAPDYETKDGQERVGPISFTQVKVDGVDQF